MMKSVLDSKSFPFAVCINSRRDDPFSEKRSELLVDRNSRTSLAGFRGSCRTGMWRYSISRRYEDLWTTSEHIVSGSSDWVTMLVRLFSRVWHFFDQRGAFLDGVNTDGTAITLWDILSEHRVVKAETYNDPQSVPIVQTLLSLLQLIMDFVEVTVTPDL